VALADRPVREVVEAAVIESMITHADPRCLLACAAFDAAIHVALQDTNSAQTAENGPTENMVAPISEMLDTAREAAQVACNAILRPKWTDATDREHLERALDEILSDLDAARDDNPRVYRPGLHLHDTAGFVRVAFRLAFWHLVHTPSWRDAVVDVASRGGDADTNAAIVGALLGARDGANAIPADWRERVLGVRQPGPADWAAAHHPKHLLALVK
jgi:ADP-ribosylglycohydrolase